MTQRVLGPQVADCRKSTAVKRARARAISGWVTSWEVWSPRTNPCACGQSGQYCVMECEIDLDGGLNHEEFEEFMKRITADTFVYVTQGFLITLAIAPTIAIATKRATEGIPGIGKVVQKLPNSVYVSLITLAVMMIQKANE